MCARNVHVYTYVCVLVFASAYTSVYAVYVVYMCMCVYVYVCYYVHALYMCG